MIQPIGLFWQPPKSCKRGFCRRTTPCEIPGFYCRVVNFGFLIVPFFASDFEGIELLYLAPLSGLAALLGFACTIWRIRSGAHFFGMVCAIVALLHFLASAAEHKSGP